ncbi:MAG: Uma2 family endonuclease [Thermomicrobiales bacterium]
MATSPTIVAYDRPLTYDDLLAMPDDGLRREIINGELIVNPAPEANHQRILGSIYRLLDDYALETHRGEVFMAPFDVILTRFDAVQPDLVFLLASHGRVPDHDHAINYPPDVAVEILSPSSRGTDRVRKMALYARAGVPEYWLADPAQRVLTVHHLQGDEYITAAPDADGVLESRVLPGLRVDPRLVFARLG